MRSLTMQQTTMLIPAVNTIEIKQGAELMIKASIIPQSQLLIVRIDDINSTNYHSRFNKEFTVRKGAFEVIML